MQFSAFRFWWAPLSAISCLCGVGGNLKQRRMILKILYHTEKRRVKERKTKIQRVQSTRLKGNIPLWCIKVPAKGKSTKCFPRSPKAKILDLNSSKKRSGCKVHICCLGHWNMLSTEDLPSPLDVNILDFQALYGNVSVTCSFLGHCWFKEEISSKNMPVRHHQFQIGLCRVAEMYSVSLEHYAEIPWDTSFEEAVWIIFYRQGVLCYSVLMIIYWTLLKTGWTSARRGLETSLGWARWFLSSLSVPGFYSSVNTYLLIFEDLFWD